LQTTVCLRDAERRDQSSAHRFLHERADLCLFFGALPLSKPINPPANEAGLKPLPVLDRPGLLAS
jgi:hypothetical protein